MLVGNRLEQTYSKPRPSAFPPIYCEFLERDPTKRRRVGPGCASRRVNYRAPILARAFPGLSRQGTVTLIPARSSGLLTTLTVPGCTCSREVLHSGGLKFEAIAKDASGNRRVRGL